MAYPGLVETLRRQVEVHTAGSAVEPGCLWTNRSPEALAEELSREGFSVCANTIRRLLREELGLGRRQASKDLPLGEHCSRDEQFQRIDVLRHHYLGQGWPVVSIDTKKKEPLGDFFRAGRAWTDGRVRALDHDFQSAGHGKVIPYGVYDLAANEGFVLLAGGADTGELACDGLERWWHRLGRRRYQGAPQLLVLADSGGSNGYRVPLFRHGLCGLARRLNLSIRVAHLPPYCSKYNPIDHRLFCHLARAIRGLLCRSVEILRDALARTTTPTGLRVVVEIARRIYRSGKKAPAQFLANESIVRDLYLPAFNYTAPAQQ